MDRTEPPVGSKTLHDLYKKYQDKWIVELLFVSRRIIAEIWVAFFRECQR